MNDNVAQIKERLNIVDVISGYVRLQKAGVNYKALCPFHSEKTPSFMVSPSRQSWHCFGGCGEGGDIFTFVEKIENIEFLDALKILADKAGVRLEYRDPKTRSEKDRLYEICEAAARFFTLSLNNANDANGNNVILDYLYKRGLKDETIAEWRLGYAPDSWDSLLTFIKAKGYKEPEIEKAGLIIKGQKYHDRFRNRLMFPVLDSNGRVAAFSGRIMNDIIPSKTEKNDSGKYINSPETVLYSKSRILYGLSRAKMEIRKNNRAVLVEGQMDAILPWQDGVKNIVATSGTALTAEQLVILKRLADNLTIAFDMDDAGFKATKRGIDLAQSAGFNISVLRLDSDKDAADFVKSNPGIFAEMVAKAESIMPYYFKEIFKKYDPGKLESKKFIALNLLSEIKRLPSSIERSNWIRELSLKIDVSENDLKEEMEQLESQNDADGARTDADNILRGFAPGRREAAALKTRKEILSERLLALLLKKPEAIAETVKAAAYLPAGDFELLAAFSRNNGDFSKIRSAVSPDLRPQLDFLYMLGDFELGKTGSDFNIGEEIVFLAEEIEREHYKERLVKISGEIKKSEALSGDSGGLALEFQDISKKLYKLNFNLNEKNKKI